MNPPDGRSENLAELRRIVASSRGPTDVIAIVNGGDGDLVQRDLEELRTHLFRADGGTRVFAHEEVTRRGQLLGLLDALRARAREGRAPPDARAVHLGIMMPGKGTRLSPLTQRLYGIKPFLPTLIRSTPEGPFLHGAAASLWTWTLLTFHLERLGFRGVAWKWGDEPQIPSTVLADLDLDLHDADAVRFGAEMLVTEDLARNKEWLFRDERTGSLIRQVRRRSRAELLHAFGIEHPELAVRALVHIGSPAFSDVFLAAAEEAFGDMDGWVDVDGYLFEALTSTPATWDAEIERDEGLRRLLQEHPDFKSRVDALKAGITARRGRPPIVKVIDVGEGLYWGDFGQLAKARQSLTQALEDDEDGAFARQLAGLADVQPDRWGNRIVGESRVPDDGSVRGSVVIDSRIDGPAAIDRALIVRSDLGQATVGPGSAVFECTLSALEMGHHALAFRAICEAVEVPDHRVHASLPADPDDLERGLEPWRADSRADVGAGALYDEPQYGNPTSFAEKSVQMRRRSFRPDHLEAEIDRRFRAEVKRSLDPSPGA